MNTALISLLYAGSVVATDAVFDNWIVKCFMAVIAFVVCYLANKWLSDRTKFETQTNATLSEWSKVIQSLEDFKLSRKEIENIASDTIKISLCNGLGKAIDEAVDKAFHNRMEK